MSINTTTLNKLLIKTPELQTNSILLNGVPIGITGNTGSIGPTGYN